jgi:hypothetical protein
LWDSLNALSTDRRWLISITNSCWSSRWSPRLAISSQEQLYHVFLYCSRCHSMWGNLVLLTDLIPFAGKVSLFFSVLWVSLLIRGLKQLKTQWSSWAYLLWWALFGDLQLPYTICKLPFIASRKDVGGKSNSIGTACRGGYTGDVELLLFLHELYFRRTYPELNVFFEFMRF